MQTAETVQIEDVPTRMAIAESLKLEEGHLKSAHDASLTEPLRYDPVAIANHYSSRPLQVGRRIIAIFLPFINFAIALWWDKRLGHVERNQSRRAVRLREMLTKLGPASIKVGQALSTRPDLVPAVYLDELTKLQDQLPPFPNEIAFRFIEEELGDRPEHIYAELSPNPIAAASLGQVYKGKLKTGEDVAVKVQRPGLAENITLDLYILRTLASWAGYFVKRIKSDLVGIMDEFGARIFEEMDYTHEGQNAERFAQLYGSMTDIYVPRIYWEYTHRRVLTMEWINGVKLTKPEDVRAQGGDAAYLVDVGVQCSLRQLLEHGFFHADPHPGNLLATPDGKLAYLDFGMMSEVKPQQRYGLIEAIVHMVNRDFEGLANDYVKLDFLTADTDLTPIIPALTTVFNNALGSSVAELNFKSITDQLSDVMYEYPFRVPAYYALIIRSLVTLEGIAINVDPNFKVLSKAYPYVARRLLTDSSPELRASLRDLLFKDGSFRWNRLENLLNNAKDSSDYDLSTAIDQATNFLFSERGDFIREYLVEEIVKGVDNFGQTTVQRFTSAIRERLGFGGSTPVVAAPEQQNLEHLTRILTILRETPGFDPMQLVPLVPNLLLRPEAQRMGQQIAGGLAQRAAARFIREFLLPEDPALTSHSKEGVANGSKALPPKPQPPLVLTAARR